MKLNRLSNYLGPNRRSEQPMVEASFGFDRVDSETISTDWQHALEYIRSELDRADIHFECRYPVQFLFPADVFRSFCQLFCDIALNLQRRFGHDVHLCDCLESPQTDTWIGLFEHEEASVGKQAGKMALQLLGQAWPALQISGTTQGLTQSFEQEISSFSLRARSLAQPAETAAIAAAAKRAGVPVIKLERDPYEPVLGEFRIRMNSMLMLGHCGRRQIIDGCFALEKSGRAYDLLLDMLRIMGVARSLGMPVPRSVPAVINSTETALLAAQKLGYPLTVRPRMRTKQGAKSAQVSDAAQLTQAVQKVQVACKEFLVEKYVEGPAWNLLVVNHQLICILDASTGRLRHGEIHASLVKLADSTSRSLNVGVLILTIISRDLSQPLSENGGVVIDLQIAPRLDELLAREPELLEKAATAFIQWLFPATTESAIPIIAITGTNGKTTTSRMIDHVLRQSGQRTGLQCTDGRYINGELVSPGDNSSLDGHFSIFEDKSVNSAVLETHHAGIAVYGFAFSQCNVAVCTNVTEDHLGTLGIETVEEMAVLKRALLERARDCAVLNADDVHCMAMLPFIKSQKTCFTSLQKSVEELAEHPGEGFCCVLELVNGDEWVVIHDKGQAHKVLPVRDIPATFDGLARFNVSNAIQAIAASYAMGVGLNEISSAMKQFVMSATNTPGRLNFYPGLPFQVLVDFSHNPDGMRRISEFADGMQVRGRKIVAFSGFRKDPTVTGIAAGIAGHFDHYMIKNYGIPKDMDIKADPDPWRIPRLIKSVLVENGVKDSQISIELDEMKAVNQTLNMARDGDLVLLLLGYAGLQVIDEFMREYKNRRQ